MSCCWLYHCVRRKIHSIPKPKPVGDFHVKLQRSGWFWPTHRRSADFLMFFCSIRSLIRQIDHVDPSYLETKELCLFLTPPLVHEKRRGQMVRLDVGTLSGVGIGPFTSATSDPPSVSLLNPFMSFIQELEGR